MKHLFILLLALALTGCTTCPQRRETVHHIVLCWLKEPGSAAQRLQVIETSRTFAGIPGVLSVTAGEVIESDRPIVDDSFDVAITMTFASKEDMQAYLVHPSHTVAVKEVLMPLASKITVYDFLACD